MRFEAVRAPGSTHCRSAGTTVLGHQAGAPVGGVARTGLRGQLSNLAMIVLARSSWTGGIVGQRAQAADLKAPARARAALAAAAQLGGQFLVGATGSGPQNDLRPLHLAHR